MKKSGGKSASTHTESAARGGKIVTATMLPKETLPGTSTNTMRHASGKNIKDVGIGHSISGSSVKAY